MIVTVNRDEIAPVWTGRTMLVTGLDAYGTYVRFTIDASAYLDVAEYLRDEWACNIDISHSDIVAIEGAELDNLVRV